MPAPLPITSFGEFPPINSRNEFLSAISSHYTRMLRTLTQSSALFRDMDQTILGDDTFALTLTNTRVDGEPSAPAFPNGIYFGEVFAASTQSKQVEVVIHEASHFKDGHNFNDSFKADSPNWGKFSGGQGILNSWSYSMFVLDVAFNRTTPFPS